VVKVFAILTRRNGIDTQAFIDHYENQHVPLVLSLAPAPLIYKRNYVVRGVPDHRTGPAELGGDSHRTDITDDALAAAKIREASTREDGRQRSVRGPCREPDVLAVTHPGALIHLAAHFSDVL
jgi:hypothetical protein